MYSFIEHICKYFPFNGQVNTSIYLFYLFFHFLVWCPLKWAQITYPTFLGGYLVYIYKYKSISGTQGLGFGERRTHESYGCEQDKNEYCDVRKGVTWWQRLGRDPCLSYISKYRTTHKVYNSQSFSQNI